MNDQTPGGSRNKHIAVSILLLAIAAGVIFILFRGLQIDQSKIPSELIGKPAYPITAAWIQGQEFLPAARDASALSMEHLRGQYLVLNFWASWCISCRQEAQELERFWQKYRAEGVNVVGIAIQDTIDDAREFAKHYGKTYILALDESGKASIDYGVTGVPETFIIDPTGKILHKEVGPVTLELLEKHIKPQLGRAKDTGG